MTLGMKLSLRRRALVGATLAMSLTATLPVAANAATSTPRCNGVEATIVGTPGNDVLTGTPGRDVIVGLAGNDAISGLAGNDLICAGTGADRVQGNLGVDNIFGGPGADVLSGGVGNDRIQGGDGQDLIDGGPGVRDICLGGAKTDKASGCEGRSSVRPVNLLQIDDPVVRTSLRAINEFRANNFSDVAGDLGPVNNASSISPLYITNHHNSIAKDLLDDLRFNGELPAPGEASRIFRAVTSVNGIGIVQAVCSDVFGRPTTAVPGIVGASVIGSPDVQLLSTQPSIDRIGISWLETNDCLYWSCLLYTSPSPRDATLSRMPSSA